MSERFCETFTTTEAYEHAVALGSREQLRMLTIHDRVLGCLLGGAVGDALGAPFEGLPGGAIPPQVELLSGFAEFEGYPRGQWTDDTQLTLATIEAVVDVGGLDPLAIAEAIARLWARNEVIGPGGACTRAAHAFLRGVDWTRCGAPVGQAGNGAAMRTAPLGFLFVDRPDELSVQVADASRITHRDPRAIAGGVAVAAGVRHVVATDDLDPDALCADIARAMAAHDPVFATLVAALPERLAEPVDTALEWIAWAGQARPELDRPIITPFVVPTVLACLWSLLRHPRSWSDAVAAVIGLGGDVDTTGAITGALAGARLGAAAIPIQLVDSVVDRARIEALAAGLVALAP